MGKGGWAATERSGGGVQKSHNMGSMETLCHHCCAVPIHLINCSRVTRAIIDVCRTGFQVSTGWRQLCVNPVCHLCCPEPFALYRNREKRGQMYVLTGKYRAQGTRDTVVSFSRTVWIFKRAVPQKPEW